MIGKNYLLHHINITRLQKLDSRNRIRPTRILQIHCFLPSTTFHEFFPQVKQPQNLLHLLFFGQVEISSGK